MEVRPVLANAPARRGDTDNVGRVDLADRGRQPTVDELIEAPPSDIRAAPIAATGRRYSGDGRPPHDPAYRTGFRQH